MSLKNIKMCPLRILDKKNEFNSVETTSYPNTQSRENINPKAAFFTTKLWPQNSEITISFIGNPSNIIASSDTKEDDPLSKEIKNMDFKDAIKKIITERYEPITNLHFNFVEDNTKTANVRIDFNPNNGSWSALGTDCLENKETATMNFAWFDVGTVLHEFGHMIGLIHEHQNPIGTTINWNKNKVYSWAEQTQGWNAKDTDTNILNAYNKDSINGTDFDYQSIMLYFFPDTITLDNRGTKQNLKLSGLDVQLISQTYPSNKISPELYFKNIYGESLQDSINRSLHNRNKNYNGIIFKLFIAIAISIIVYFVYKKYKNDMYMLFINKSKINL